MTLQAALEKFGHLIAGAVSYLISVGLLGLIVYVLYRVYGGLIVQILGLAVAFLPLVLIFLFVEGIPRWLSKGDDRKRRELSRLLRLYFVCGVGVVCGSYLVPSHGIAWYWRVLLGMAGGTFALMTRRFP